MAITERVGPQSGQPPDAASTVTRKGGRSKTRPDRTKAAATQFLLGILGLGIAAPLLFIVSVAFKSQSQWVTNPLLLVPRPVTTENFGKFLDAVDMVQMMLNTLVITVLSVIGTVASCAVVAYPLARLRFRGRGTVTVLILATLMLPAQVLLIPQYLVFVKLHWIDTLLPLIVPNFFAVNAFIVFFLRQAFRTIPRELEDAVLIDGGGYFTAFVRVVLPLSRTPLVIAAILQGVASYNDYFTPLVYLHSPEKLTMAIGVPLSGASIAGVTAAPVVTMGTLLFVLPIAVVFIFAQRWLTNGVSLTGSVKS